MGVLEKVAFFALLVLAGVILLLAILTVVFMCVSTAQERRWEKENLDDCKK